ncbi:MAG: hypothetical protein RL557_759, partial [archaeon]
MKTKIMLSALTALIAVMSIMSVFAVAVTPTSLKFSEPTSQLTFTVSPPSTCASAPCSYTISLPTILMENGFQIMLSASGTHVAPDGNNFKINDITTSEVITIAASNIDYNEINVGKTYSGNIVITNTNASADTTTIPVSFTSSFCSAGEKGTDLEISNVEIDNSDGDEDAWSALDEISIDVEISNEGSEKINDVFVELGLFDGEGKNIIKDMDDLDDDEVDLGNIGDGDEDTATFKFKVPADFESGNYRLVIKAYSDDVGENELCSAHASDLDNERYQTVSGEREEDEEKQVIFNNIKVSPSPAQCGDRVQITGEVSNIGDEDYEDQVKVTLYNKDLGLNIEEIVREDLDQGDSELVDFEFDIPSNTDEKSYVLEFTTYYEYDEDDDDYGITSDKTFTESLRVEGNCKTVEESKSVAVTAELDTQTPQAIAGKQVIVNAHIRNTGDSETTYILAVSGADAWAEVASLDPKTITLAPDQSRDVVLVLNVNDNVEGEKELTLRTSFEGSVKEQKIKMFVAPTEGQGQQEQLQPVVKHLRDNWFI